MLLMQLTREAPSGYAKVNMEQLLRADREMFTLMAQEHCGPFLNGPKGELPLDLLMTRLTTDPRVSMHLLPLPNQLHVPQRALQSTRVETRLPLQGHCSQRRKPKHLPRLKQIVLMNSRATSSLMIVEILFAGLST
jgi:hypothetical protein